MKVISKIKMFFNKVYFYLCLWFYDHSEAMRDIAWLDNLNKDKQRYVKKGLVPTRLKYKDRYPSNSRYKTPEAIRKLKDEKEGEQE